MKRVYAAASCAALLAVLPLGPANAAPPVGGCPSEAWQTSVFPLDWQPGDPMDPTGDNLLLQIGIAGTIEEFGSVEAGLEAFGGFETLEDFYAVAVDPELNQYDKNDDGVLCIKPFPAISNKPAYLVNAVDNNSHSTG